MITVRITDQKHPHYGESGELKSKQTAMNGRMFMVVLEDCSHGTESCYAEKGQFTVLSENDNDRMANEIRNEFPPSTSDIYRSDKGKRPKPSKKTPGPLMTFDEKLQAILFKAAGGISDMALSEMNAIKELVAKHVIGEAQDWRQAASRETAIKRHAEWQLIEKQLERLNKEAR